MQGRRRFVTGMAAIIVSSLMVSGCATNLFKHGPSSKVKIKDLEGKIVDLQEQQRSERERFEKVKRLLEEKLKTQISDKSVSLEVGDRGLVIILSDNVLFDSGKALVKSDAYVVLDEVVEVIKNEVPDKNIGISGHTDNEPIKYSSWKSNWELSSARATNVLHYLVEKTVSPDRLSATGHGEHKPVAANDTFEGRAQNRRVEIVILPDFIEKKKDGIKEDTKEDIKESTAEEIADSTIK